jgi:hypothetical protein
LDRRVVMLERQGEAWGVGQSVKKANVGSLSMKG